MDRQTAMDRIFARKLRNFRINPPTLVGLLARWTGPLLAVGVAGTVILAVLPLPPEWPIANAALFLGAMFRDIGIARRAAQTWPAQSRFIDWAKVDEALSE